MTTSFSLSAEAAIFVPRSLQSNATIENQQSSALSIVRSATSSLTASPGSFHEVMPDLCQNLVESCKTKDDVNDIISHIFNLGVSTSSVRYLCARILVYLNRNAGIIVEGQDFRHYLILKCNCETDNVINDIGKSDKYEYLSGTTLFLGEIFLNMISPTGQRMGDIGSKLLLIVEKILKHSYNREMNRLEENVVISIIDVVKMTGAILAQCEHFKKHGCLKEVGPPHLQNMLLPIFTIIEEIIVSPKASRRIRMKLLALVKLRANNFGLKKNKCYELTSFNLKNIDCPVFYYNAGHIYSPPEAINTHNELYGDLPAYTENGEFTGGQLADDLSLPPDINDFIPFEEDFYYNGYEPDNNSGSDSEVIDDEIAEAYEEFLEEQQKKTSSLS